MDALERKTRAHHQLQHETGQWLTSCHRGRAAVTTGKARIATMPNGAPPSHQVRALILAPHRASGQSSVSDHTPPTNKFRVNVVGNQILGWKSGSEDQDERAGENMWQQENEENRTGGGVEWEGRRKC